MIENLLASFYGAHLLKLLFKDRIFYNGTIYDPET